MAGRWPVFRAATTPEFRLFSDSQLFLSPNRLNDDQRADGTARYLRVTGGAPHESGARFNRRSATTELLPCRTVA
jgi:hypothetical protein